jgi:FkbM family methyltransferase
LQLRVTINAAEWLNRNLEYLRYEYDLSPDDLVIDIGAYKGEWAERIFNQYGCKLICIEPTDAILGFENGEIIKKAASAHNGTVKFGGQGDSVSEFAERDREYECFDINWLLEQHEEIALAKLNVEGAEYSLLNHIIDAGLHKRIKNLQVQFHQIEGQPYEAWYNEIAKRLSATHKLDWQYNFCWESWVRLREDAA